MSWQQVVNLWDDYGPGAVVVLIIIVLLVVMAWAARTLVKWWPVITQLVSTINIVAKLPDRLDKIDRDNATIVAAQKKTDRTLNDHLQDAKNKTDLLAKVDARGAAVEQRLSSIEEKAAIAAEQSQNNGGSTIKDKIDKVPATLDEIRSMLSKLLPPESDSA